MTKEIVVEDSRGRGMTAKVTDTGKLFDTYKVFANKAGYPDAACSIFGDEKEFKLIKGRAKHTFKVLARGNHDSVSYSDETIYVIESEDGERFLIGDAGLEITEHVAKLTPLQLHEMGYEEALKAYEKAVDNMDELSRALRRKAYAKGYEQGRFDQRMKTAYEDVAEMVRGNTDEYAEKTPQERRDEIVEQAKADIEGLKDEKSGKYVVYKGAPNDIYTGWAIRSECGTCEVDFAVNKDKRTVVALLKGTYTKSLYAGGIAKCVPSDCFNVHIGKAIALRRALGMDVPVEYLDAPPPTEVRVGDVVRNTLKNGDTYEMRVEIPTGSKVVRGKAHADAKFFRFGKVIDDSRDEYSREEDA